MFASELERYLLLLYSQLNLASYHFYFEKLSKTLKNVGSVVDARAIEIQTFTLENQIINQDTNSFSPRLILKLNQIFFRVENKTISQSMYELLKLDREMVFKMNLFQFPLMLK